MATTVILGSGIIGLSTAYYLTQHQPGSTIYLVDSSAELFSSASGFAGGFLAKNWFQGSVASLGALSFEEHRKLAEEEGGREKWGYAKSVTLGCEVGGKGVDGGYGEDWLLEGGSRVGVAGVKVQGRATERDGDIPGWLKVGTGDGVDVVDGGDGTAVVDPLKLCQFLLQKCKEAGVHIDHPATALSITTDTRGELSNVRIGYTDSSAETEIPATRLLLSAGAWTPRVFASLFGKADEGVIPIGSLGGHSLVVRKPGVEGKGEKGREACHSIYCTLEERSAEVFSRADGGIYLSGVNSPTLPLPELPNGATPPLQDSIDELKRIAKQLIVADSELEVVRTGLCFRPITDRGTPFIGRLEDDQLGAGISTRPGQEGGVFVAAGHGPWGISLSLGTGKVMAEMMSGKELSADVSRLGL